jgi:DNA helicase-4
MFTGAPAWSLAIEPGVLVVTVGVVPHRVPIGAVTDFLVTPGLIWAQARITAGGHEPPPLDGIPNASAQSMGDAVRAAIDQEKARHLADALPELRAWMASCAKDWNSPRWISGDMVRDWLARKPSSHAVQNLLTLRGTTHHAKFAKGCSDDDQRALSWFFGDLNASVAKRNQEFLTKELDACRDFFAKIESSPLTDEQARAVVCFDNRIQLVASAGSGKTSTLVAKVGFALHRKLCEPSKILLLAFNAKAAEELRERIQARLSAVGLPGDAIQAQTFHAFGLRVIGAATQAMPSLAPWLDQGEDVKVLAEIVDALKDRDPSFRSKWDMFRVVFGRSVDRFGEEPEPEDWDRENRRGGYRTLKGEVVKSQEERWIADWLFYQGVNYTYEHPYEIKTETAEHRQYRPDFYYPDINVYHEHFALDANGRPPDKFRGYAEGMAWKRQLHKQHNTTLWETTSHTVRSWEAWKHLEELLRSKGVQLDPNPDRPIPGRPAVSNEQLLRTMRTFLTHAKSNCLTAKELRERASAVDAKDSPYRSMLFVDLFLLIWEGWEQRLRKDNLIDFEDMLNLAAEHIEKGRWKPPYELVLVDEFQDASRARARLTRALVATPHRYLCAVGDDWQSINRFAGADLSVMTEFETWFGPTTRMKLERTFRCPQALCDVSSKFVQRNPAQIKKVVRSQQPEVGRPVELIEVPDENQIRVGIEHRLRELHEGLSNGSIPTGRGGRVTVSIL